VVAQDAARVQELWANPDRVAASDLGWLEELVAAYPAAVPLWWLYVRAVQRAESPKFAQVLQRCAAISPDRSALMHWVEEPLIPQTKAAQPEPQAEVVKPEPQAEVPKPEPKVAKPEYKIVKPEPQAEVPKPEPKIVKPDSKVVKPEPQAEVPKPEPKIVQPEPKAEVPQSVPAQPKEIDLDSVPEKVRAQILRSRAIMAKIKGEEPATAGAPAPAPGVKPALEPKVAKPEPKAEVAKPEPQAEVAKSEPQAEVAKPEPQAEVAKPEPQAEVAKPEPKIAKPEPKVVQPEPEPKVAQPEPKIAKSEPKAEVPKPEPEVSQSVPAQPKEIDLDSVPEKVRAQILRSRAIMAKIKGEEPAPAAAPVPAPALAPAQNPEPQPTATALVESETPESPVVADPLAKQDAPPKPKAAARAKQEVVPNPSIPAEAVSSAAEGLSPFAQFVARLSNAAAGPKAEDLIDEFLSTNPRISPLDKRDKDAEVPVVQSESSPLVTGLVTETLARLYADQGHAAKAIQAYEILKLRVPEKSLIFAARIEALRNQ
jgi:hypothetical protein